MALRLSGQSESRTAVHDRRSSRQAGGLMSDRAAAISSVVVIRRRRAALVHSELRTSTLGSKAPPLRPRQASQAESRSKSSGDNFAGAFPPACHRRNSLSASYPLKILESLSISRSTRSSADLAAWDSSAATVNSSEVPITFSRWKLNSSAGTGTVPHTQSHVHASETNGQGPRGIRNLQFPGSPIGLRTSL